MKLQDALPNIKNVVTYAPELVEITGHLSAAVLLAQMIFWTGKGAWFFKSAAAFEEETGLTYYQQKEARKKLRGLNLIEERQQRRDHKMYFRVKLDVLRSFKRSEKPQEAPLETTGGSVGNHSSLYESSNKDTESSIDDDDYAVGETPPAFPFSEEENQEEHIHLQTAAEVVADVLALTADEMHRSVKQLRQRDEMGQLDWDQTRAELLRLIPESDELSYIDITDIDASAMISNSVFTALQKITSGIVYRKTTLLNPPGYLAGAVRKERRAVLTRVKLEQDTYRIEEERRNVA